MKIFGAVILLVTAVAYGFVKIREERAVLREIDTLTGLVRYIRDNIQYYMKPLSEIFASYQDRALEDCGFLEHCRSAGIREAWEAASFRLPEKARAVMTDFTHTIGGGYREDELKLCDHTLEQLEKIRREMGAETGNREKLYRTIPPLLALSVVLLFL